MKNKYLKNLFNYFFIVIIILLIILILIYLYAYNSGSCKINKKYICDKKFCLYKEFYLELPNNLKDDINSIQKNKNIQKRVEIKFYPEMILNCAVPNKSGITISTQNIQKLSPNLIKYYQYDLCDIITKKLDLKLYPSDLRFPTSCAILIYEKEGDWINWHYDHNYYNGRFFTVLIPITNEITCTEFQLLDDNGKTKSINLTNGNCICFEGNYLYHSASKLCDGQRRVILSCQYVTDNNMNLLNKMRINIKDFAYTGKLLN